MKAIPKEQNKLHSRILILTITIILLSSVIIFSQTPEKLIIPKIIESINLDGTIDEQVWKKIDPIYPIMFTPNFKGEPTEKTEVRIGYDDDFIYIAASMYDSEPEKIQGPALNRDNMSLINDWIGIILDTFNDKENAITFFTNPEGLRTDFTVFNDAEGGFPLNPSWNTFWDVEVTRNEKGWFAEFRIPISSIRFQEKNGHVVMGFIAWRLIARKNEFQVFPAIPPQWGFFSILKPSQAKVIMFEDIHSQTPLYITPYALGGLGQKFELNASETAYVRNDDFTKEMGLDIKYGITSNLTMDLTFNTDFAQVEADDQQVNLTRFSLFFPEKRLFFQERSSIFEVKTGGINRIFYSRRIGISDDKLVDIYGGIRLIGRVGNWDMGFLDMQTAKSNELPSENFGVLRLRRQVFNENSYIGGILTSRAGIDGNRNIAVGLDGIFRTFEDEYFMINLVNTVENENRPSLNSSLIRANWERRTADGFGYDFGFRRVGSEYNPGIGFVLRKDYTRFGDKIFYGWIPGKKSSLLRHILSVNGYVYFGNEEGKTESAEFGPEWSFSLKSGASGGIELKSFYEDIADTFEIGDKAEILSGKYSFYGLKVYYSTPSGNLIRSDFSFEAGSFYDGWRLSLVTEPIWNISRHFELGMGYEFNYIDLDKRYQYFRSHIARLRLRLMFSTRFSASSFIQYDNIDDEIIVNLRFRYNPREGNDLYLVYNEGINTNRLRTIPHLPYTNNRTILVKYSYTFQPLIF